MPSYLEGVASRRRTPQSKPIPGTAQVANNAGGYTWALGPHERLRRFLVLGSEGGSYYVGERELTEENAASLWQAFDELGASAVEEIEIISVAGRAPRQQPTLFALAMAAGHTDPGVRRAALAALPQVCRTGTMLFEFLNYVEHFRGWGRALKSAVGNWYTERDIANVAFQTVKYRQREGWSHRDVLRQAHPKPPTRYHDLLFKWVVKGGDDDDVKAAMRGLYTESLDHLPDGHELRVVEAYERAQHSLSASETVALIEQYGRLLPREAINPDHLSDPGVAAALVEAGMPITALMRNLANLTRYGVVGPMGAGVTGEVLKRLTDPEELRRGRVHPLNVLLAMATYEAGHGFRGQNVWEPVAEIVDALNEAFYLSFDNVEPTRKRTLIGLDISPSMHGALIANSMLTVAAGAAAMAMVAERLEPWTAVMAFTSTPSTMAITSRQRLTDILRETAGRRDWGGTDCALPMLWALKHGLPVDAFYVYTDNETWAGDIHPAQALALYREKSGIDAKLVVVGMASNGFSIADPNDAGMLDVVGFDAAAPTVMADFVSGRL